MKLHYQFLAQISEKMMRSGGYYSLQLKAIKKGENLKEKLKQIIQCKMKILGEFYKSTQWKSLWNFYKCM